MTSTAVMVEPPLPTPVLATYAAKDANGVVATDAVTAASGDENMDGSAVTQPPQQVKREPQDDGEQQKPAAVATASTNATLRANALQRLRIQIQFAEKARQKIENETHPDLVARYATLESERTELLRLASLREEYLSHCTSVIFAYECEEANSEFLLKCEKLRHDMLDEIHHEIEIINDQRKGVSSARKTTRKTRSTRSKGGDSTAPFALDTAEKIKKRAGSVFRPLEKKLAQSEVEHDVRELSVAFEASKKRRMEDTDAEDLPFARYHRAKFLYQDLILQEGDEVYVQNQINGNAYVAIICSITSTELFVISEKGKYHRLVIMDIRHGKIVLDVLTPEQSDALLADSLKNDDMDSS
ncbi:TPA: hypothetical protein N0F65_010252 [Lagenidium giganteum]|uniref:Uncharacterized protein n=1 Tax=Lagenidium giganteum TaxID=4803 RepID=A0AAV2YG26_9STRA|nr:TPA: hypothetical protein N0F65_010252 [Lagenidium giganteum]